MKAVILAAGYNTRLQRDLISTRGYEHLLEKPKPLIPLAGKPLIEYLLVHLHQVKLKDIFLITNQLYHHQFVEWERTSPQVYPFNLQIVNDGTVSNEERLGAVADAWLVIQEKKIDDDLLIVAGDLLFYSSFRLEEMVAYFYQKRMPVIAVHREDGDLSKRGVVEMDSAGRVTQFIEKPLAPQTSSRLASTALYVLPKRELNRVGEYTQQTSSQVQRDAPGHFIAWLHQVIPVYAFKIPGRHDVGTLDDYRRALQLVEA